MNPYRQHEPRLPAISIVRLKSRIDVRHVLLLIMCVLVVLGLLSSQAGCTPGQRQTARDVLSIVTVACIIANHNLPDERVQQVCGIVDAMIPAMREVLSSSRAASAKDAADAAANAKAGCR